MDLINKCPSSCPSCGSTSLSPEFPKQRVVYNDDNVNFDQKINLPILRCDVCNEVIPVIDAHEMVKNISQITCIETKLETYRRQLIKRKRQGCIFYAIVGGIMIANAMNALFISNPSYMLNLVLWLIGTGFIILAYYRLESTQKLGPVKPSKIHMEVINEVSYGDDKNE